MTTGGAMPPLTQQHQQPQHPSYQTSSTRSLSSLNSNLPNSSSSMTNGAIGDYYYNTIRFQVVVWYVGAIDVIQGRVPVTFRVTLFWNDVESCVQNNSIRSSSNGGNNNAMSDDASVGSVTTASTLRQTQQQHWSMRGRQTAVAKAMTEAEQSEENSIPVPAVSILNVVTFDTIGDPEVALLNSMTGLWRWTCMYRATLLQDHWRVHDFPHDQHVISLKLAVLAHRRAGAVWDRSVWKLATATAADSAGSTRHPAGLLVDQVKIPEFHHDGQLVFEFKPLDHGQPGGGDGSADDDDGEQVLEVKLHVQRDSNYFDRNIVPLLGLLNFVAISITALGAEDFFQRALLTLNIAFVEISIRMTTDKHLPSVAYQIKLQRVLNEYFFGLLFLVLESNLVYELHRYGYGRWTGPIDTAAALSVLGHNAWTLYSYYTHRNPRYGDDHHRKVR